MDAKTQAFGSAMTTSTSAWGVFPHAEQREPTGRGYVVRRMESGYAVDQHNYGGIVPVAVFSHRGKKAAERVAEQWTREPQTMACSRKGASVRQDDGAGIHRRRPDSRV